MQFMAEDSWMVALIIVGIVFIIKGIIDDINDNNNIKIA